jgi:hypothetical protein
MWRWGNFKLDEMPENTFPAVTTTVLQQSTCLDNLNFEYNPISIFC